MRCINSPISLIMGNLRLQQFPQFHAAVYITQRFNFHPEMNVFVKRKRFTRKTELNLGSYINTIEKASRLDSRLYHFIFII